MSLITCLGEQLSFFSPSFSRTFTVFCHTNSGITSAVFGTIFYQATLSRHILQVTLRRWASVSEEGGLAPFYFSFCLLFIFDVIFALLSRPEKVASRFISSEFFLSLSFWVHPTHPITKTHLFKTCSCECNYIYKFTRWTIQSGPGYSETIHGRKRWFLYPPADRSNWIPFDPDQHQFHWTQVGV